MKNILLVLVLAFLVPMMMASASEIEITSPVAGEKYYVWDEVPIEFTSLLGEGYIYSTYVNGVETDVFAPEKGGRYVIRVLGENPDCEECFEYSAERIFKVGYYPRTEETQMIITSPVFGVNYLVNDTVPIEFESPLTDRDDFVFKIFVTGPDGVNELMQPYEWKPTMPGEYGIKVKAVGIGNGFQFASSLGYVALALV